MIKVVRDNKATTFENIEVGTLFFAVYDDTNDPTDYETVFLKIPLVDETNCDNPMTLSNNAVVVIGDETGNLCRFESYDDVIPIHNAKFIIGD